ncbi:MAG: hypothetical protein PHI97_16315 [Desulfobulbus sp.]|nr:hypothetical protein [Desulfobulbus sp.]
MKVNANIIINLAELIGSDLAFGNEEGRRIYQKLSSELDKHPGKDIFGISLKGIKATDASFPRESVISLLKSKKGEIGFYLLEFSTNDLRDNWDYAAKAKDQPIIVLGRNGYELIGPVLTTGAKELLDFIMKKGTTTTSKVAEEFGVSAQNASAKLKKLFTQGVIMGAKESAETGGVEFVYRAIK